MCEGRRVGVHVHACTYSYSDTNVFLIQFGAKKKGTAEEGSASQVSGWNLGRRVGGGRGVRHMGEGLPYAL